MHKDLAEFPVVVTFPVAWGEMDAFGHVNNIVYFRYFESARIAYFGKIGFIEVMRSTGIGPILASTSCKFRKPLTFPDTVFVGARVSQVEEDRFVMQYRLVSQKLNAVAAEGEGLIVSYSYDKQKKVSIPSGVRKRIEELESHCFK